MKTTKGGKVMNPTDAYRKELRKKELKRNKKERKKVRKVGILKKDPETLKEQIDKLEMMTRLRFWNPVLEKLTSWLRILKSKMRLISWLRILNPKKGLTSWIRKGRKFHVVHPKRKRNKKKKLAGRTGASAVLLSFSSGLYMGASYLPGLVPRRVMDGLVSRFASLLPRRVTGWLPA